ncbi:SMI1/KNR4 family protein [Prauserella oleivorans]
MGDAVRRPRRAPGLGRGTATLDLDAEAEAHREVLAKRTPGPRAQTLREHAAAAEQAAAAGDTGAALAALARWAEVARELPRPDVATLAACRHVAPLLVRGALAVDPDWAWNYAGALIAALTTRYRSERDRRDWRDLIAEIMRLRGEPGVVPPPASPAAIADAERRLGVRLPAEYRQFLLTCDGLRADVVFPGCSGCPNSPAPGPPSRSATHP